MDYEPRLMKTESSAQLLAFHRTVAVAVSKLKERLQEDYEDVYPGLSEIIGLVLDEEEARAWELTPFPHLVLPDLVKRTSRLLDSSRQLRDTTTFLLRTGPRSSFWRLPVETSAKQFSKP